MIRLKELLTEGRTQEIPKKRALDLYHSSKIGYNITKDQPIFRGVSDADYKYGVIDPSQYPDRKSENTRNYYTLIINNSEVWSGYPKREIVCTTRKKKANVYGGVYQVIPFNGADWGICPTTDIWQSFGKIDEFTTQGLNEFNNFLLNLTKEVISKNLSELDFIDFQIMLNHVGEVVVENNMISSKNYEVINSSWINEGRFWMMFEESQYYNNGKLADFVIEELLHPDKNDFEYQNNWTGTGSDREVWTDVKCLLIRNDAFTDEFL